MVAILEARFSTTNSSSSFNFEGAQVVRGQSVTGTVATDTLLSRIQNPELRTALAGTPRTYQATSNPFVGFHERNVARTNDELTTLSRIDYNFGKHNVAFRFSYNNQDFDQPLLWPNVFLPYPTRFRNVAVQDNYTISNDKLNEFRFGYNSSKLDRFAH